MRRENFEIRFGQQWDLFSPQAAASNNTNANLWYAGNRGFRRGQIQLRYQKSDEKTTPMLQLSVGEGAKETSGLGADNYARQPMFQGRAAMLLSQKYELGMSFVHAKFAPNPDDDDLDYTAIGFCIDWNLSLTPKVSVKGEFNQGTNLNNVNMFNIAGNGRQGNDRKCMGMWLNLLAQPKPNLHLIGGFGMDKNQTENLPDGAIAKNFNFYGDLIFPFEHGFSITAEILNIMTELKGGTTHQAVVVILAGKLVF